MPEQHIINKTKGVALAHRARISCTFGTRLVGLLGRRCLERGEGMILIPCSSIHTFFMRFPIDVLFLDGESRVVFLAKGLKPFRVSPLVLGARCAIELPAGTIEETGTEKGDLVIVEPPGELPHFP